MWRDTVLVHVRLLDGLVVVETDNMEEGIKSLLGDAGIPGDHIVSGMKYERMRASHKPLLVEAVTA